MPVTSYKVWQWAGPVGQGATGAYHVSVMGVAKAATPDLPFTAGNEFLCGRLAQFAGLPVPPGFIVHKDGTAYYVSLNFNLTGQSLPPADAAAVVHALPLLAVGAVMFDAWIVNMDRHQGNLAFDSNTKRLHLFDHSHAFYSGANARQSLEAHANGLGFSSCLAPHITDISGARSWSDRFQAIPEYVIEDAVEGAIEVGLPAADRAFCMEFLLDRRARLLDLFKADPAKLPSVQHDLWNQV